jgi:hypothetical protein
MTCGSQIRNYPEIVKYFNADELMEGTAGVQLMYGRDIVAPPGNQVEKNREHKHRPVALEVPSLLDKNSADL